MCESLLKRIEELETENRKLKDQLQNPNHWVLVAGSPWESAVASSPNPNSTTAPTSTYSTNAAAISTTNGNENPNFGQDKGTSDQLNESAIRQIKYEFYCATVDLFGFSLYISPDRMCTIESAFPEVNGEKFRVQFIYDKQARRYTDLVWTENLTEFIQPYQFWVLENQCIPGFLAQLFLYFFELYGAPPGRH